MPKQEPAARRRNFEEVASGYDEETALREASRCLHCPKKPCVTGCPVNVDIPAFIDLISRKDYLGASRVIKETNSLPAVCGRVCPQEDQCEKVCTLGVKFDPVAVGRLERFVADYEAAAGPLPSPALPPPSGKRVAVVGSGPAGVTAAGALARLGHAVTVFEALHKPGGVLGYGIPEFRLPKAIVAREIDFVRTLGVDIRTDVVVGRTLAVDDLFADGYHAVFLGNGAGLPVFMNIPGENLSGVYSANEFLTRVNLMKAYLFPRYDTPIRVGRKVAVIGGGNVAMDSARTALRLGAEQSFIVYRRSREEMPARREELENAEEEGVEFILLTNPVAYLGNERGWVRGLRCLSMELGEPDASGRRRPMPVPGSEFELEADAVVVAAGSGANPLVSSTTGNLEVNNRGYIVADPETGRTSRPGVFAGGDIVTGSATVISAMGAGRRAAGAIDEYLKPVPSEGRGGLGLPPGPETPLPPVVPAGHAPGGGSPGHLAAGSHRPQPPLPAPATRHHLPLHAMAVPQGGRVAPGHQFGHLVHPRRAGLGRGADGVRLHLQRPVHSHPGGPSAPHGDRHRGELPPPGRLYDGARLPGGHRGQCRAAPHRSRTDRPGRPGAVDGGGGHGRSHDPEILPSLSNAQGASMPAFETIIWEDGAVVILDQTRLPREEAYLRCRDWREVGDAIRRLSVRGAPAIGVAAALGLALGARQLDTRLPRAEFDRRLAEISRGLAATRPTAVNLFWALERMERAVRENPALTPPQMCDSLLAEAQAIREEDIAMCRALGRHGARLIPDGARILTHCNAGALATAGYGTALGVIRAAVEQGKRISVLADETRPLLQGARLTAWELAKDGIPVTVITDNMAASFMARGAIDLVIVGADRIAANGDAANKIGTYGVAVLAHAHGLPFYVAAPSSTFDLSLPDGAGIPIEERGQEEVTIIGGVRMVAEGVPAANPAFDVTPARLIAALITERGVISPPSTETIARVLRG